MKFFVTSFLVIFCLAPHSSGPDTVRTRGITMIRLASTDRENEPLKADFIGGGIIQDSCRGEVKFSSKLNHIRDSLDWIRYEVTPANSKAKIFEGWWHWKATPSFMSDYRGFHRINLDDPHEDMDLGEYGDEDGWQEECEHRSTDISQCDRMFGHNMYYPERLKPNNGILTGKGDPQNPIYYEITFNSKTKDGCTQKWTDRLVFQMKIPN